VPFPQSSPAPEKPGLPSILCAFLNPEFFEARLLTFGADGVLLIAGRGEGTVIFSAEPGRNNCATFARSTFSLARLSCGRFREVLQGAA
jgi:hypothetical protein